LELMMPGTVFRPLILTILLLALFVGCGPSTPSSLAPTQAGIQNMAGLALSEEIYLNFKRQAMVKLVPASESVSIYRAEIRPGGKKLVFKREGPGELYLAWVPAGDVVREQGKAVIVLTGHEIKTRGGVFRTTWPPDQAPVISSRFQPGRVTYLGLVKRRMYLTLGPSEPDNERTAAQKKSAFSRVELIYSSDREGKGLIPALHNSPWLKALILNPPPGLKILQEKKQDHE